MTDAQAPKGGRRRWLLLLLVVVIILAGAVVAATLLVDAEKFRGPVEQALRDATGWEAEIGAISLSVLRGMVLTVSPVRLNAPDDGSSVEVETVRVRAELLPLLQGRLSIRRIGLVGPEIVVVRKSLEKGWELPAILPVASSGEAADPEAAAGLEVAIDEIVVRDGSLRLEDRAGEPPLSMALDRVALDLSPTGGAVAGQADLAGGDGRLSWRGNLAEGVAVTLDDLPTDRLHDWIDEDLVHGGGRLSGEVLATFPLALEGRLVARGLSLLEGTRPLEEATMQVRVATRGEIWILESLELEAAGARVVGSGSLLPAVDLELELPETSLETAMRVADSVAPLPLDVSPPGSISARLLADTASDGELSFEATGEVSAASLRVAEGLPPARDVRAAFELTRAGTLEIRVLEGQVSGGPLRGSATISPVFPPGRLSFDGGIEEAVLGQLMGEMVGQGAERVTGPTGISADVALDLTRDELDARALGGRLDLDAREVTLPGWDLDGAIGRAVDERLSALGVASLLEGRLGRKPEGQGGEAGEDSSIFDRLEAGINFDAWPWKIEKVALAGSGLSATGDGSFDPIEGRIGLQVTSRLDRRKSSKLVEKHRELRVLLDREGRLTFPVEVEGSLLSPSIKVDLGKVLAGQLEGEDRKETVKGLLRSLIDRKKEK